jgi:hypothetical protein
MTVSDRRASPPSGGDYGQSVVSPFQLKKTNRKKQRTSFTHFPLSDLLESLWKFRLFNYDSAENMTMLSNRRTFVKAALGGVAGLSLSRRILGQAGSAANTVKLADDLYIVTMPGEANVVVQIDAKGALLVDGGSAAGSDALLKTVAGLPGSGAVHTLFNTHWHPEQTGSNEKLGKSGATIIAHENTRLG